MLDCGVLWGSNSSYGGAAGSRVGVRLWAACTAAAGEHTRLRWACANMKTANWKHQNAAAPTRVHSRRRLCLCALQKGNRGRNMLSTTVNGMRSLLHSLLAAWRESPPCRRMPCHASGTPCRRIQSRANAFIVHHPWCLRLQTWATCQLGASSFVFALRRGCPPPDLGSTSCA